MQNINQGSSKVRNLVIGASGQVGEALVRAIASRNEEVIGTYNEKSIISEFTDQILPCKLFKLDIQNYKSIERLLLEVNPDVIFICAANTNVDGCELNPSNSYDTNVTGLMNIVNAVNEIAINNKRKKEPLIIFYSTDYVFDGNKGLYNESDITNPINVYGKHKLLSEEFLKTNTKHSIIIRTNGVFSSESKNFVGRLVKNLKNGNEANISEDEFGTPTYAPDLVDATLRLVDNVGYGLRTEQNKVVNLVGCGYVSRYQFAQSIAKIFNCDLNLIKPIFSKNLNRPAARPLLGGLCVDLAETLISRKMRHYIDCLIEMNKLQ